MSIVTIYGPRRGARRALLRKIMRDSGVDCQRNTLVIAPCEDDVFDEDANGVHFILSAHAQYQFAAAEALCTEIAPRTHSVDKTYGSVRFQKNDKNTASYASFKTIVLLNAHHYQNFYSGFIERLLLSSTTTATTDFLVEGCEFMSRSRLSFNQMALAIVASARAIPTRETCTMCKRIECAMYYDDKLPAWFCCNRCIFSPSIINEYK